MIKVWFLWLTESISSLEPRFLTKDGGFAEVIFMLQVPPSGSVAEIVKTLLSSRVKEAPLGWEKKGIALVIVTLKETYKAKRKIPSLAWSSLTSTVNVVFGWLYDAIWNMNCLFTSVRKAMPDSVKRCGKAFCTSISWSLSEFGSKKVSIR